MKHHAGNQKGRDHRAPFLVLRAVAPLSLFIYAAINAGISRNTSFNLPELIS